MSLRRLLTTLCAIAGLLVAAAPAHAIPCKPPRCVVSNGSAPVAGASRSAHGAAHFTLNGGSVAFSGPAGAGAAALPGAGADIASGPDGAA